MGSEEFSVKQAAAERRERLRALKVARQLSETAKPLLMTTSLFKLGDLSLIRSNEIEVETKSEKSARRDLELVDDHPGKYRISELNWKSELTEDRKLSELKMSELISELKCGYTSGMKSG
ncbi:hypothetical protein AgCh_001149 [Apium graveolens]